MESYIFFIEEQSLGRYLGKCITDPCLGTSPHSGPDNVLAKPTFWSRQCFGQAHILVQTMFWPSPHSGPDNVLAKPTFWSRQCFGQAHILVQTMFKQALILVQTMFWPSPDSGPDNVLSWSRQCFFCRKAHIWISN